jgi:hypothetical protein
VIHSLKCIGQDELFENYISHTSPNSFSNYSGDECGNAHNSSENSSTYSGTRERNAASLSDESFRRKKNTEAARRSRARKAAKLESLSAQVHVLEKEKNDLLLRVAVLENDLKCGAFREDMLIQRVTELETLINK